MEDRKRLFQRILVLPVSCVDLRNVAALCGLSGSLSLAALTKELTGTDLNKDSGVRRGDWEADILSPAQASDSGCLIIKEVATMLLCRYMDTCVCMHTCLASTLVCIENESPIVSQLHTLSTMVVL